MQCCWCNRASQCRGCTCIKTGQLCSNCLPGRLESCPNTSHHQDPAQSVIPISTSCRCLPSIHIDQVVSGCDIVFMPETLIQNRENSNLHTPVCNESTHSSQPVPSLPPFTKMANPYFVWSKKDSASFSKSFVVIYDEVIHWRRNCFHIPLGNVSKSFVEELAR